MRGRRGDAVEALQRAELLVPHRVQRDPFARDVMAELLARARRDAMGRELRAAWRTGPVCPCSPIRVTSTLVDDAA
ncbi:MAG: hypothetical protein ACRDRO_09525 [Pseudonocardiaceae bacterium]